MPSSGCKEIARATQKTAGAPLYSQFEQS